MALLTVKEVADRLRVAPITVRRHIAAGRLPAVRVGRLVRVEEASVVRFTARPGIDDQDGAQDLAGQPLGPNDPLWELAGMFDAGPDAPTDVATNKDKYLANAYADLHDDG